MLQKSVQCSCKREWGSVLRKLLPTFNILSWKVPDTTVSVGGGGEGGGIWDGISDPVRSHKFKAQPT